jgi:hypothetical protein
MTCHRNPSPSHYTFSFQNAPSLQVKKKSTSAELRQCVDEFMIDDHESTRNDKASRVSAPFDENIKQKIKHS